MSEEIKDIFECLKKYANLTPDAIDDLYYLEGTIEDLQQKVEQLEKENKELNRMCELYGQSLYNADLTKAEKKIEQLENIRKEAIEYVEKSKLNQLDTYCKYLHINFETEKIENLDDLLNILNKGDNDVKG